MSEILFTPDEIFAWEFVQKLYPGIPKKLFGKDAGTPKDKCVVIPVRQNIADQYKSYLTKYAEAVKQYNGQIIDIGHGDTFQGVQLWVF